MPDKIKSKSAMGMPSEAAIDVSIAGDEELKRLLEQAETTAPEGMDRETAYVEGKRPDTAGERKAEIGKIESAETIDRMIAGLTKILAGMRGVDKGIDLSQVATEGPNWKDMLDRRLDTIKQKSDEYEQRRQSRLDRLNMAKQKGFALSLEQLRETNRKTETKKLSYTAESQNLDDKINQATDRSKELRKVLAGLGSDDEEVKNKSFGMLEAIVGDPELVTKMKNGEVSPVVLADLQTTFDGGIALAQGKRDLLGELAMTGTTINNKQKNLLGALERVSLDQLDPEAPAGWAVYNPTYAEIRKEIENKLKSEMEKEAAEQTKKEWYETAVSGVANLFKGEDPASAKAELAEFNKNPKRYREKLIELRSKTRPAMQLPEYTKQLREGKIKPGYKFGVRGLGAVLKRLGN